MKHIIKTNQKIDIHYCVVIIELLPDNDMEKNAVRNCETFNASEVEKNLVNDYIQFNAGLGGQVLEAEQTGNIFTLKVFV